MYILRSIRKLGINGKQKANTNLAQKNQAFGGHIRSAVLAAQRKLMTDSKKSGPWGRSSGSAEPSIMTWYITGQ
jgi:hypothetical protein